MTARATSPEPSWRRLTYYGVNRDGGESAAQIVRGLRWGPYNGGVVVATVSGAALWRPDFRLVAVRGRGRAAQPNPAEAVHERCTDDLTLSDQVKIAVVIGFLKRHLRSMWVL